LPAVKRLIPVFCAAGALALGPAARAQVSVQLSPNAAGAGAHLLLDAGGADAGFRAQQIPTGLAIALQKGFAVDPNAVGGVCADDAAQKFKCPPNSIVGTGSLKVLAEGIAFGPHGTTFIAQLTFYRAAPRQPGDPMGVVFAFREPSSGFQGASIGRLMAASEPGLGDQLRFDKLPIPALPGGFHFTLQELKLDLGAGASTPPVRVAPKRRARRRRRHVPPGLWLAKLGDRYLPGAATGPPPLPATGGALLTTPATCAGTWQVRFEVDYGDGPQTHDAAAPCVT
jgi:hypothetical protein